MWGVFTQTNKVDRMKIPVTHPKLMRVNKLEQWFVDKQNGRQIRKVRVTLREFIEQLKAEDIDPDKLIVYFQKDLLTAIALPEDKLEIELSTTNKSLLNSNWRYTEVIDEICSDYDAGEFVISEYRFSTGVGCFVFKCKDKTVDDLKAFIDNIPDVSIYSIVEVFEDHPITLCNRYDLTDMGLYHVTINFKDGFVL